MTNLSTEGLDFATMSVADKVGRHARASMYLAMLKELKRAADRCGCFFSHRLPPDPMPFEVFDYMSLAMTIERTRFLTRELLTWRDYRSALDSLKDGVAQALLRDVMAALSAMEVHFRIGADGVNHRSIENMRRKWTAMGMGPCDVTTNGSATIASSAEAEALVDQFLADLQRPTL